MRISTRLAILAFVFSLTSCGPPAEEVAEAAITAFPTQIEVTATVTSGTDTPHAIPVTNDTVTSIQATTNVITMAPESTADVINKVNINTAISPTNASVQATATATIVPTIAVASTETVVSEAANSQSSISENGQDTHRLTFGVGGLVLDLEEWAQKEIKQFYTASHIDIRTLQFVSKYRSRAGHDYSGSFGGCSSNKHYFHPLDFYEVALSTPIYSASDGVFLYIQKETGYYAEDWKNNYAEITGKQWPESLKEYQLFFRPDEAPNLWIRYHHVTPIDEMFDDVIVVEGNDMMMHRERPKLPGFRVQAGDLIAHGLGEISIEQHLDGTGIPSPCTSAHVRETRGYLPGCLSTTRFLSIFDHMTDEVFSQYKKLADVERADFIVTEEELTRNPYTCTGEFFDDKGNTPDADTYVLLQGTRGGSPSNLIDGDMSSALNVGDIVALFEGTGNGKHGPFALTTGDIIAIKSDGGPLAVRINRNGESRQLYSRPEGSGSGDYETLIPISGAIGVELTAAKTINWQVVVVRPK